MDVITYEYTKQRKDFGKHPSFGDSKPECISIKPSHGGEPEKQWVERMHTTTEVDCIPETAEHWVNTERFVQCHRGMQHTGGGWPKDVKSNDNQDRERFLRRLEALPPYSAAVRKLTRVAEKAIEQNNSIDIYEEYFASSEVDLTGEPPSAKTLCVFRDRSASRRAATKLCWHPDGAPKLAVAYSCLGFQQMPADMPLASYIWDVNSPNEPDVTILPPSPLSCLVYNPRTTDHMVGGCYNGLIGFWDLRKGSQPVECSVIEKSHHDPVYDIFWIQSRTGNECCSVSTDGQILWWDTRKLDAGPTDSMSLRGYTVPGHSDSVLQQSGASEAQQLIFGATCLDYRSDAGATRYLLGTEEGQAVLVDRKAKKEMAGVPDTGASKSIKTVFGAEAGRHHGPIYSIQRHPFAPKYFMTVGDWTTKVWMEDLKTPIMSSRYDSAYLTNGCWSPTRPSVLMTTKVDGTLDVWDLLFKQTDPVFSTKVGDQPLCSIRVHPHGRMVAVGAADGTATIVEINNFLAEQQPNEKANIIQMLERETKREKNLEIRSNQKKKEATAGAKKGPSGDAPASPERPTSPQAAPAPSAAAVAAALKADEKMESLLKQVEADFFKAIEVKESVPALSVQTGAANEDGETVRTEELEAPGSVKRADSAGKGKDSSAESGKSESDLMERAPNSAKTKLQDDEEARKALDDGQEPAAA